MTPTEEGGERERERERECKVGVSHNYLKLSF